jgi:hypothetical protein
LEGEAFDKVGSEAGLVHVHQNGRGGDAPREMNTKEPLNNTQEINLATLR